MSAVTTMQITYAAKDSTYNDMQINQGDYLGVIQKELITSPSLDEIITQLASKINDLGSQMVSIYYGQDVTENEAQNVLNKLSTLAPNAEINLYFGGQAVYYYIISAE